MNKSTGGCSPAEGGGKQKDCLFENLGVSEECLVLKISTTPTTTDPCRGSVVLLPSLGGPIAKIKTNQAGKHRCTLETTRNINKTMRAMYRVNQDQGGGKTLHVLSDAHFNYFPRAGSSVCLVLIVAGLVLRTTDELSSVSVHDTSMHNKHATRTYTHMRTFCLVRVSTSTSP